MVRKVENPEATVKTDKGVPVGSALDVTAQGASGHSWARPIWYGIKETKTLQVAEGRDAKDEKHICIARDSLVLTRQDGYKPIQDVVLNDLVLTHEGRWRPVLASKRIGERDVVELRAQGVPGLRLTPDHQLWTRCAETRRVAKNQPPEWIRAEHSRRFYVNLKLPEVESIQIGDERHWWVVGRWLACGSITTRGGAVISCGRHRVDELLSSLGEYGGNPAHDTGTACQVLLKDRAGKLRRVLKRCGHLSHIKRIPPEAFVLPQRLAGALLAGYLSGDGHYLANRGRWLASSVSRNLLLGIATLAQRVHGAIPSIYAGRRAGKHTIQGRQVNTRQDWILSFDVPNVERANGLPFVIEDGAWKKVRSVQPVGKAEVWNLRVDEDESFTVEGCIVKNCPLQLETIERAAKKVALDIEEITGEWSQEQRNAVIAAVMGLSLAHEDVFHPREDGRTWREVFHEVIR